MPLFNPSTGGGGGTSDHTALTNRTSADQHPQSAITNLEADLAAKAPLASPGFTGTPTAPTAVAATNTTQVATTAFVAAAVSALLDSAPGALDTLNELAAALGDDANFSSTVTNALALKAPLDSPALTGTPLAPTAAGATNTTQVATTAYVRAEILSRVLTSLSVATSADVTAADSILVAIGKLQAQASLKAAIASPTFTGVPAAPTAAAATNTTQVATTAYTRAEILSRVLTGLSTADSSAVTAADGILVAVGKLVAAMALRATSAAPSFTGLETHGGTDLFTAAPMGADVIDVTKARNTKTVPGSNPTYTFSATPSDGQEFGLEITGDTTARTVTIPSSRNVQTNEDITSFVMPANGYAVVTWRRKGSVNLLAGVPGTKVMIPFAIETAADGDYTIVLKSIWAGTVTGVTTKSASGTCTLTGRINATALGGTANSVSSTEQSQAHSSANVVAVGDDLVVTVSGNSSCLKLAGNIEMTVF